SGAPAPLLRTPPAAPAPAPTPAPAAPAPTPSLEAMLLRFRLVTPDQMSEAMKEEAIARKPIAEIVVERGWVSQADLDKVVAHVGGVRVVAGSFATHDAARAHAEELVEAVQRKDAWTFVAGKPLQPEKIRSIFLES